MSKLKNRLVLTTIAVFIVCMPFVASAQMIITGVIDGPLSGGTPKGVELLTLEAIADLSAFGLGLANNGGGTDGEEFTFPAVSIDAGAFIYVSSEAVRFLEFFGFDSDYVSSSISGNGDDAYELFHNGVAIDLYGNTDIDGTGTPWEYKDGWAYRVNDTPANGGSFVSESFFYSGPDALDGATDNATADPSYPIGTFTYEGLVANESTSWGSVKAMFN